MGPKTVKLSRPVEPNIHRVLQDFLEQQRTRLAPRTLARYEDVLDLLRSYADFLEFDHFPIARVEPGRLWLEAWEDGKMRERGPIPASESATRWLRPGWTISCSLGRVRKSWRLLEVANVYPG